MARAQGYCIRRSSSFGVGSRYNIVTNSCYTKKHIPFGTKNHHAKQAQGICSGKFMPCCQKQNHGGPGKELPMDPPCLLCLRFAHPAGLAWFEPLAQLHQNNSKPSQQGCSKISPKAMSRASRHFSRHSLAVSRLLILLCAYWEMPTSKLQQSRRVI